MDTFEIALNFSDPQHQGDRRKKSQQCFLEPVYGKIYFRTLGLNKDPRITLSPKHAPLDRLGRYLWQPCQPRLWTWQGTSWKPQRHREEQGLRVIKPGSRQAFGPELQGYSETKLFFTGNLRINLFHFVYWSDNGVISYDYDLMSMSMFMSFYIYSLIGANQV